MRRCCLQSVALVYFARRAGVAQQVEHEQVIGSNPHRNLHTNEALRKYTVIIRAALKNLLAISGFTGLASFVDIFKVLVYIFAFIFSLNPDVPTDGAILPSQFDVPTEQAVHHFKIDNALLFKQS